MATTPKIAEFEQGFQRGLSEQGGSAAKKGSAYGQVALSSVALIRDIGGVVLATSAAISEGKSGAAYVAGSFAVLFALTGVRSAYKLRKKLVQIKSNSLDVK